MATITTVPFSISSLRTLNCHNQNLFFYKPNILTPSKSFSNDFSSCKLVTRHRGTLAPIRSKFRRHIVANSDYDETELASDSQPSESFEETKIDLQLPRRSLLVAFTCNSCSVRTERLISRFAYEKGTIFVQCAGCLKHHKLVDNLQVVVEYNFLEEDRKADLE